jgi:16S rRNA (adenine1518-N6/adenine1519-N6)-dimethyltransferase
VALASAVGHVLAIEFDRALLPALREVLAARRNVEVLHVDAMRADWSGLLGGRTWRLASNLPYNIATPLVLELLTSNAPIVEYLVMVQREVGERLVASPGDEAYGAVSAKVAYLADASVLRRVPATVFWPRPKVESVLVRITPRRDAASVTSTPAAQRLFRLIEVGFAERRKTMRNALRRLGLDRGAAVEVLAGSGLDVEVRAEELDLAGFERLAERLGEAIPVEGGGSLDG